MYCMCCVAQFKCITKHVQVENEAKAKKQAEEDQRKQAEDAKKKEQQAKKAEQDKVWPACLCCRLCCAM